VGEPRFLRSLAILNGWSAPRKYLSVRYEISPRERLVSVWFSGKLSARGIETYATSLRADPRFDPTFAELVDLCQVEEVQMEPEEAMRLADQVDPFSADSKRAFVTKSERQLHFAKLHQLLQGGKKNISLFNSLQEAKHWLAG
jgi:hypothetical protein